MPLLLLRNIHFIRFTLNGKIKEIIPEIPPKVSLLYFLISKVLKNISKGKYNWFIYAIYISKFSNYMECSKMFISFSVCRCWQ